MAIGSIVRLTAKYSKIAWAGEAKKKISAPSPMICQGATSAAKTASITYIAISNDAVAIGPCRTMTRTAENCGMFSARTRATAICARSGCSPRSRALSTGLNGRRWRRMTITSAEVKKAVAKGTQPQNSSHWRPVNCRPSRPNIIDTATAIVEARM